MAYKKAKLNVSEAFSKPCQTSKKVFEKIFNC